MSFDNRDIPTAAFIEHFIFDEVLKQDGFSEATQAVAKRFNVVLPDAAPFVQTRLLALAYCLLVFPTEIWRRAEMMGLVVEYAKRDPDISKRLATSLSEKYLRHLRNATSHARIRFVDGKVEFMDVNQSQKQVFREEFSLEEAANMLLVLGRAFNDSRGTLSIH